MQEVLVDAANVVVGEFFSGWLLPVGFGLVFLVIFVGMLVEGVVRAVVWWGGRAARKKADFIQNMRLLLREMGSEMGERKKAVRVEWAPKRVVSKREAPKRLIMQPIAKERKRALEDQLDDFFQEGKLNGL